MSVHLQIFNALILPPVNIYLRNQRFFSQLEYGTLSEFCDMHCGHILLEVRNFWKKDIILSINLKFTAGSYTVIIFAGKVVVQKHKYHPEPNFSHVTFTSEFPISATIQKEEKEFPLQVIAGRHRLTFSVKGKILVRKRLNFSEQCNYLLIFIGDGSTYYPYRLVLVKLKFPVDYR